MISVTIVLKMKTIVHSTTIVALDSILKTGMLLDQNTRKRLKITYVGEGLLDRKIGKYTDIMYDPYFYEKVDEAAGVYFRMGPLEQKPGIQLIFSTKLLTQYPEYIFNTEENFGFVSGENGTSPFTGELMTTYFGTVPPEYILKTLKPDNTEILIPESVNLDNLIAIKYQTH